VLRLLAGNAVAARAEVAARAPKPLDSMTAHVSSVARAADGREIFTLDNHQVCVELLADGNWLGARTGEKVTICHRWFDSYRLSLPSRRCPGFAEAKRAQSRGMPAASSRLRTGASQGS